MDISVKPENMPAVLKRIETAVLKHDFKSKAESLTFLRQFVTRIGKDRVTATRSKLLNGTFKKVSKLKPGQMYLFHYDPKYKDTLPIWDAFPLIFVLNIYDNGFLGLNLHHVPPVIRQKIFIAFLRSAVRNSQNDIKRLKLDYEISMNLANDKIIGSMVKRYLWTQMRSHVTIVPPELWESMLFLPMAEMHKN
jgi:hypothetical protein